MKERRRSRLARTVGMVCITAGILLALIAIPIRAATVLDIAGWFQIPEGRTATCIVNRDYVREGK